MPPGQPNIAYFTEKLVRAIYERIKLPAQYFEHSSDRVLPESPIRRDWSTAFDYPRTQCVLDFIKQIFTRHQWAFYEELKDSQGKVPNEERNVCQCWILAQKKH